MIQELKLKLKCASRRFYDTLLADFKIPYPLIQPQGKNKITTQDEGGKPSFSCVHRYTICMRTIILTVDFWRIL